MILTHFLNSTTDRHAALFNLHRLSTSEQEALFQASRFPAYIYPIDVAT